MTLQEGGRRGRGIQAVGLHGGVLSPGNQFRKLRLFRIHPPQKAGRDGEDVGTGETTSASLGLPDYLAKGSHRGKHPSQFGGGDGHGVHEEGFHDGGRKKAVLLHHILGRALQDRPF